MSSLPSPQAAFASRHIGINETDIDKMLDAVGRSFNGGITGFGNSRKYSPPKQNGLGTSPFGT
jgi:hypothetical protein